MNDCSGNVALMNAIGQLCFRTLRGLKFTHLLLDKNELATRRYEVSLYGLESHDLSMINNPKKDAKEEVIIFLTIKKPSKVILRQYTKRWRIEYLFHHLKTNGFNLEDINLADAAKNNLMMAIVSLAYALTIKAGWKKRKSVRSIKYKDGTTYPAESVFRIGLSEVLKKSVLLNCRIGLFTLVQSPK